MLQRFLDPTVLSSISSLDLVAKTVVDGFVSGLHRSPTFGFSQEFAEYRQYVEGDDLRHVDWNVYARNDRNEGTLYYNGKLGEPADAVFLNVFADDRPFKTETKSVGADQRYAFTVKLQPGLIKYRVEFGVRNGGKEQVLQRVGDLVCGDAYLIDGQSNALATDTGEDSPREASEWIRSYGGPTGRDDGLSWVRARMQEAERNQLAVRLRQIGRWPGSLEELPELGLPAAATIQVVEYISNTKFKEVKVIGPVPVPVPAS